MRLLFRVATPTLAMLLATLAAPAAADGFTAAEMMKLKRLSDPQVSPDGKWVAYTVTDVDLAANSRNNDLWVVALAGGEPRRLTSDPKSDTRPRWSPDGKRIAFISSREGRPQAYVMDATGGEPRKVTSLSTGVNSLLWIDGNNLLVVSEVFPDCNDPARSGGLPTAETGSTPGEAELRKDAGARTLTFDDACNKKKLDEAGKPSSARVYERLLYRHWDTWEDGRRSHLLVVPLEGGAARDLTPGDRDVPPFSLGGPDDFAVSADGQEVCFVRNDDEEEAASTDADLFVVPVAGGQPKKIADSAGYDGAPRYSPDGTKIAFRAQMRAGYESDRWRLMVYDRKSGATRNLTEGFDRHLESFAWSPDSRTVFFTAGDKARDPIYSVPAAGGPVKTVLEGHTFSDLSTTPDGRTVVATKVALTHPTEIYRINADGTGLAAVTKTNDDILARFKLRAAESVTYPGAAGKTVQAWIVKPTDFDPAKKYPLLVLIHGGPQSVWGDSWSYRWNAQVFANAGYVVFAPNPRGSTSFGQEFIDDINADWGGRAYEDILKGTDYAEALPYIEKGRTLAAGASFGGYMINWIAGHTDRYKALVSHDGVFDLRSMYGSTEELWFPEWEFKGPYWKNPEMYERWSPSLHAKSFKTPTLVIHGEQDHRVPLEQGLGMFTALRRQGVPSKLVVFPDENHWVLKPANSVRWYQEVIGWLDRWTKN